MATAALFLPCAISASTSASRGVSRSSGDAAGPAGRDQHLDHLGVDDGTAGGDLAQRGDELLGRRTPAP